MLTPGERWARAGTHAGSARTSAAGSARCSPRRAPSPNVDVFAGGTYRVADRTTRTATATRSRTAATRLATGIGKVTVRPADGHEVKLGAHHLRLQLQDRPAVPNQESVYDTNVVNNILNGALALQPAGRPSVRLRRQRLLDRRPTRIRSRSPNGTPGSQGNPITGFVGDCAQLQASTPRASTLNNTSRFDVGEFRNAFTYGGDYFQRRGRQSSIRPATATVTTPNGERTVSGAFVQWKVNYSTWLEVDQRAALRQLRARRRRHARRAAITSRRRSRSASRRSRLHGLRHLCGRLSRAGGHRDAWSPARTRRSRPASRTCSPSCRTRPCGRRSARPRKSASTSNTTTSSSRATAARQGQRLPQRRRRLHRAREVRSADHVRSARRRSRLPAGAVVTIPINSYSFAQYQNIGNARIEGVEFEGTYDAGAWFVGLSGQHIRGRDVTNGDAAAHRPAGPDHHAPSACGCSSASSRCRCAGRRSRRRRRATSRTVTRTASRFPPDRRLQSGQPLCRLPADAGCAGELRHR